MSQMGIEKLYGMVMRELESDAILEMGPETYREISEFVGNLRKQEFDGVENEIRDLMTGTAGRLADMLLRARLKKGLARGADPGNLLDEEKYVLDAEEETRERADMVSDAAARGKPLLLTLKGLRSLRTGDYRIVYRVIESRVEILVVAVGHRRDVYARVRKLLDYRR